MTRRPLIALGTFFAVAAVLAWPPAPLPASIERHFVDQLTTARVGAAALVLIERGRIVAKHGFRANPDESRFVLASVSKAVTAWGVMKLVQDGRIGLDDPVILHLKRWQFPAGDVHRGKVTVRHLLSHTGGLDDGFGYGGFAPGEPVQTLEESLTLTKDSTVGAPRPVRVANEPGTSFAYSGGGYTVLQLLIEEVSGQPFSEYMRDHVLRPLQMNGASFEGAAMTSFDADLRPQPPRRYTALAAVALRATAADVAQFALATLHANPVLRRDTIAQMLTPQPATGGTWGLGYTLFGGGVIGHDGGTYPAWGAFLRVNPRTQNAMILLVDGGRGAVNQLGDDWLRRETGIVRRDVRDLLERLPFALVVLAIGAIAWMITGKKLKRS